MHLRFVFLLALLFFQKELAKGQDAGKQLRWYKGNLHTHSLWSDGNDFPEMITKWYHDHGYHFLALTDHNILSEGEKWMSVDSINRRGTSQVVEKLRNSFGDDWIVKRTKNDVEQIRSTISRACPRSRIVAAKS